MNTHALWTTNEIWTNPIVVGFGIACFGVLVLTLATMRKHRDMATLWLGGMLLALWFFSKLAVIVFGYWPAVGMGPIINMGAVVACMVSWFYGHRWWKLILALLMEVKALIHAEFWTVSDPTYAHAYGYILALNVIFALELACVAMPGIGAVGSMVGNRLSRHRGGGHYRVHPVAAP